MRFRFLADENISKSFIQFLRKTGHDVKDIKEEKLFGLPDGEIIKIASKEDRVILTHDKEFGGILLNPSKFGRIIFIRYSDQLPKNIISKFSIHLKEKEKEIGRFPIVFYDKYAEIKD